MKNDFNPFLIAPALCLVLAFVPLAYAGLQTPVSVTASGTNTGGVSGANFDTLTDALNTTNGVSPGGTVSIFVNINEDPAINQGVNIQGSGSVTWTCPVDPIVNVTDLCTGPVTVQAMAVSQMNNSDSVLDCASLPSDDNQPIVFIQDTFWSLSGGTRYLFYLQNAAEGEISFYRCLFNGANGNYGVYISSPGNNYYFANCIFENFYDALNVQTTLSSGNLTIYNCTFGNSAEAALTTDSWNNPASIDNCAFIGNAIDNQGAFAQSDFNNCGFGSDSVIGYPASDMVITTAAFNNSAGDDFHLVGGSPLIDTGTTLAGVTVDYDGVSRPQGPAYDIGAFEYPFMTPTNTATSTATQTATETSTETVTNTATQTLSNTATNTVTQTATQTPTQSVTNTATNSATATSTNTATLSATNTGTYTPTVSSTSTGTGTASNTASNTATVSSTNTATNTATNTPVDTFTYTNTATDTATNTASNTSTATATDTATQTATETATATVSNTETNTATQSPTQTTTNTSTSTATQTSTTTTTNSPTNTVTMTSTNTATHTASNTATVTATTTVSNTPTYTATNTGTPTGTNTPTTTTTNSSTLTVTNTATNTTTLTPTNTQTIPPSFTPTPTPSMTSTPDQSLSTTGTIVLAPVPVPRLGNFYVFPDRPISACTVELFDVVGEIEGRFTFSGSGQPAWSIGSVAPGVYIAIIKVTYDDGTKGQSVQKIVVSR